MLRQRSCLRRLKITMSPWLLRSHETFSTNSAQAILFISLWLTLVVIIINILLCLSGPTLDGLKIWQRPILSRFLERPNKFWQSSASRNISLPHYYWESIGGVVVRALVSRQCGPGSVSKLFIIFWLSLLVLYFALRGFFLGLRFSPLLKICIWLNLICNNFNLQCPRLVYLNAK